MTALMARTHSMLNLDQFAAQNEKFFEQHWIETPHFIRAAAPGVPIILGAKGGGKSALRRYLSELQHDSEVSCPALDLGDFRHALIHRQLAQLVGKIGIDDQLLLASYWRQLFLLHALRDVSIRAQPGSDQEVAALAAIRSVLADHNLAERPTLTLLSWLGTLRESLDSILMQRVVPQSTPFIFGLTCRELDRLERLPNDERFSNACLAAATLLTSSRKHVCLIVDGLDKIRPADSESHAFILGSIVQAVSQLALDSSLSCAFSIKVLVPRELFRALNDRDLDQYVTLRAQLSWDRHTLKEVLKRRVAAACRRAQAARSELSEFLPEKTLNGENTIDYLIRHTMYRPRQLLTYFHGIAEAKGWLISESSVWNEASAEEVVHRVEAESVSLAQHFVSEYRTQYPQLRGVLESLAGLTSVLELGTLREKFGSDCESHLNMLYDCGAIGLIEIVHAALNREGCYSYRKVGGIVTPINCEFIYKPGARPFWLPQLPNDTLMAVHPMLRQCFGVKASSDYVIG